MATTKGESSTICQKIDTSSGSLYYQQEKFSYQDFLSIQWTCSRGISPNLDSLVWIYIHS
jgi:hypothetical protein